MRWWIPLCALLAAATACEREPGPEDMGPGQDTTATAASTEATGAEPTPGGGVVEAEPVETTVEGGATAATSADATGAPPPPGGYAVESRPAADGRLAVIEYASPRTVAEATQFYDARIDPVSRVEVDVAGDNLVAYGLAPGTTIDASTTPQDIERLLDQRSEPMVVISPWQMQRNDPLVRDLRGAGQTAQAEGLLNTKSKVTVVYAVP